MYSVLVHGIATGRQHLRFANVLNPVAMETNNSRGDKGMPRYKV
jgi:hypothetical protein